MIRNRWGSTRDNVQVTWAEDPMLIEAQCKLGVIMDLENDSEPENNVLEHEKSPNSSGSSSKWVRDGPTIDLTMNHLSNNYSRARSESDEGLGEKETESVTLCALEADAANPISCAEPLITVHDLGVDREGESEGEGELNRTDETLYKINECMLLEWRKEAVTEGGCREETTSGVSTSSELECEVPETVGLESVPGRSTEAATSHQQHNLSSAQFGALRLDSLSEEFSGEENLVEGIEEDSEEERYWEVGESKGVWQRGGLWFDSSGDNEILVRLFNCDPENVKRATKKDKKQKQYRKPPSLQGRTLTTRKLLAGVIETRHILIGDSLDQFGILIMSLWATLREEKLSFSSELQQIKEEANMPILIGETSTRLCKYPRGKAV
ncbi:hypothetical protein PIB30_036323 [Stylosanthes scabra]|uniref:Uncharacterized protein n=1 Tax=Stylosanthes scabra TaxID=79078 RepID=A0ABU6UDW7_9FABA|nr:hypothetical protein [Stylosanthes scabra]